jgi:hypothetical protein
MSVLSYRLSVRDSDRKLITDNRLQMREARRSGAITEVEAVIIAPIHGPVPVRTPALAVERTWPSPISIPNPQIVGCVVTMAVRMPAQRNVLAGIEVANALELRTTPVAVRAPTVPVETSFVNDWPALFGAAGVENKPTSAV